MFIITSFYLLFLLLIDFVICKKDPILQFSNYTVITPKYYDVNQLQINLNSSSNNRLNCDKFGYIKLYNNERLILFTLKVFVNSQFLSNNYYEKYQLNGSSQIDHKRTSHNNECFFRGYIVDSILNQKLFEAGTSNQVLALNLFRNTLNGFLSFNDKLFFIHFHDDLKRTLLFDNDLSIPFENDFKCGHESRTNSDHSLKNNEHVIDKRSTTKIHGVYQQNSQTRFVELVIVNDHKLFLDYGKDKDRLINRSKQIANVVNLLYNQLNVFIVLVGVIVWTEEDEIEITSNGDETLNRFLEYRKTKLLPQQYNDNAQLLTNITFKDNVVGKALKGPICTEDYSGGVNSDHNRLINVVATTVAHELFHNFGGEHDPTNTSKDNSRICTCPQSKCIMSPSSGSLTPRYWSNCSIESFKEIYLHGMDSCLKNLPKETISNSCGNGILEGDEECDTFDKNNTCCDFRTCKLKVNATCATGSCCNLDTCQLFKLEDRKICRKSADFCDLPEYCDGVSEFCEPDLFVYNGLKCTVDGEESYCYDGKCMSHKSQCKLLFGDTAKVSIERCFQENANNASQAANCGIETIRHGVKRFKPCKKKDMYCGRLHCLHKNKLEFGLESAATQSLISRNGTIICQTAVIDLGIDIKDPGLVANGVKCGENRMCLNQQCVQAPKSVCRYNCNGNGICNNLGNCHCFDGYHLPYCDRWSFLSSLIFLSFVCLLIAIGVVLVKRYKERIITWWIVKQNRAAIKKRAKNTSFKLDKSKVTQRNRNANINFDLKNLEISSPIPVSVSLNDENKTTTINHTVINSTSIDYTNENINRLWESRAADLKPESINKFVQLPNRIAPVRKAPPLPPTSKRNNEPNIQSNSLCNESSIESISQSNQVSKLKERFEI